MKKTLCVLAVLAAAGWYSPPTAQASPVVFSDDFSNGAVGAPVSINDPDPNGNPETVLDNTSVSGDALTSFSSNQRPWDGDAAGGGTLGGEAGGVASWTGTITPIYNFSSSLGIKYSRQFTVILEDLDPIDSASGTSGNWAALSLFRAGIPQDGGGVDVLDSDVGLGFLFRDSGLTQGFSKGSNFLPDTVFDASPSGGTYDVEIRVTNISGFGPGNSFDYDLVVDGTSINSGTITDYDTTNNYISLETRNGSSQVGRFAVITVPEPSTYAIALACVAGMGVWRKRVHRRK